MNNFTKKAISTLTEANTTLCTILTNFCKQYESSDFPEVKAMYDMMANLRVLQSQYADTFAPTVKEGELVVHNDLAMIEIDGVQIIGDIQFEIFMQDKWIKGHRMNSPMGQAFISREGSWILYDGIKGKVSLPLIFDNSMAMESACVTARNACLPINNTCMPAGACAAIENACLAAGNACSPINNTCVPAGACAAIENACSPAGNACSPVNNTCVPVGACAATGNTCSPINNACSSLGNTCSPMNNWTVF